MTHSDSSNPSEPMDLGKVHKNRPRGRPPQNYVWDEMIGYVHLETGVLFDRKAQRAVLRARKTAIERRRYWDPAKDVRTLRLLRCRIAKTKAHRRPALDEWCVQTTKQ